MRKPHNTLGVRSQCSKGCDAGLDPTICWAYYLEAKHTKRTYLETRESIFRQNSGENHPVAKLSDLKPLIIQEWQKRPLGQRTENDVLKFYGRLERDKPHLLSFRASGDKYQVLMSILSKYIEL